MAGSSADCRSSLSETAGEGAKTAGLLIEASPFLLRGLGGRSLRVEGRSSDRAGLSGEHRPLPGRQGRAAVCEPGEQEARAHDHPLEPRWR